MRSEVLKAVSIKITVLSDVTTCSLVYIYGQFGGMCCLHDSVYFHHTEDTGNTSLQESVNIYQTTYFHIPEDSYLLWT
jgi:hypothetical protein